MNEQSEQPAGHVNCPACATARAGRDAPLLERRGDHDVCPQCSWQQVAAPPRVVCGVGKATIKPGIANLIAAAHAVGAVRLGPMTDERLDEIRVFVEGVRASGINGPVFVIMAELHAEVLRVRGRDPQL